MPNCGETDPGRLETATHEYITPKEVIQVRKDIGRSLGYILDNCSEKYGFRFTGLDDFINKLKQGKFGSS